MKKIALGVLSFAAVLLIPAISHASTYQYVSTTGYVETESVSTLDEAFTTPMDISPNSGVILEDDSSQPIPTGAWVSQ